MHEHFDPRQRFLVFDVNLLAEKTLHAERQRVLVLGRRRLPLLKQTSLELELLGSLLPSVSLVHERDIDHLLDVFLAQLLAFFHVFEQLALRWRFYWFLLGKNVCDLLFRDLVILFDDCLELVENCERFLAHAGVLLLLADRLELF